jgi:hypothetical protein
MLLLDTDIFSLLTQGHPLTQVLLDAVVKPNVRICFVDRGSLAGSFPKHVISEM